MAKVKVERTLHDNVKIVLDQTSALKLASILNWSDSIVEGTLASRECKEADVEELSWSLWRALLAAGVEHDNL